MIKAFIALILLLVGVDVVINHGAGTSAALEMAGRASHGFASSIRDSIFSH